MFELFKKKKPTTDPMQAVIDEMMLYGQPFRQYIEKMDIVDDKILQLQMRIFESDDTAELEKQCHKLQQKLYPIGIKEVNINVTVSSKDNGSDNTHDHTTQPNLIKTHHPTKKTDAISAQHDDKPPTKAATKQSQLNAHPRITHIIAVASGKGGVGKSTTTVNLALALQKMGKRVGILDADIYGPSIPTMLGVATKKPIVENDQFIPIDANGMAVLSIGNLIDAENTPIAWRGIKATGALMQLYNQTNWPQLDYLLIDMPPGTGDIQLTLAQRIPLTGAIIVTTPQHIALLDAKKGVEMFHKTDIRVLGIIENMALHTCTHCGHTEAIFGTGGGDEMAKAYDVPLLGQLPLDASIRAAMDNGKADELIDANLAWHYEHIAKLVNECAIQFTKKSSERFF